MSWELHAAYGGLDTQAIAHIMNDPLLNPATRAELLAAALATPFKETARQEYQRLVLSGDYQRLGIAPALAQLHALGLENPLDDLALLPGYSWSLRFRFRLARPYLSQDDDAFYVIDNPVRKDKVFQVPFVAPTSWKGSLRSAAMFSLVAALKAQMPAEPAEDPTRLLPTLFAERARLVVLFGNEKEDEARFLNEIIATGLGLEREAKDDRERQRIRAQVGKDFERYLVARGYRAEEVEGRQGRLSFFPTYFDRIGLEIINPHLRDRRVGKNPIPIECVPDGADSWFQLLYVPFDLIGADPAAVRPQVGADLETVAQAVHDLFTVYGFGAKTSSGYGVAEPRFVQDSDGKGLGWLEIKGVGRARYGGFEALLRAAQSFRQKLEVLP